MAPQISSVLRAGSIRAGLQDGRGKPGSTTEKRTQLRSQETTGRHRLEEDPQRGRLVGPGGLMDKALAS